MTARESTPDALNQQDDEQLREGEGDAIETSREDTTVVSVVLAAHLNGGLHSSAAAGSTRGGVSRRVANA